MRAVLPRAPFRLLLLAVCLALPAMAGAQESVSLFGLDTALAGTGVEAPSRLEFTGVVVSAHDTTRTLPADFIFDRLDLDRDLLLAIRDGFPEGTYLELLVAAADRNFVNAVRGGGFNPSGNVRISSVVGDGVGYFGSLVPLRLNSISHVDLSRFIHRA
jgi:hypothetical protein